MTTENTGPIFILGFPRSGTTALAKVLGMVDSIQEYSREGHYLYFFAEFLEQLRKRDGVNPASLLLDNDKLALFEQELAMAVQRFNRGIIAPRQIWVDKTPDLRQVQNVPVYARLFKGVRFLFVYRSPIEIVESNINNWPEIRRQVAATASRWVETMSTWRRVRDEIPSGSYLEVFQADLRRDPETVMCTVGKFLGLRNDAHIKPAEFLEKGQINTRRTINSTFTVKLTWLERKRVNLIVAPELIHWPELQKRP